MSTNDLHCLYSLTLPSGKQYFGITKNLTDRWERHKKAAAMGKMPWPVLKAIRQYGHENVEVRKLGVGSREFIQQMEIAAIAHFRSRVPNGYNVSFGGDISPSQTPEARKKISDSAKKRYADNPSLHAAFVARRWSGEISQEYRQKRALIANALWADDEHRRRQVAAHSGKKASDATKELMSKSATLSALARPSYGKNVWMTPSRKFAARVKLNGVRKYLGAFATREIALMEIERCLRA